MKKFCLVLAIALLASGCGFWPQSQTRRNQPIQPFNPHQPPPQQGQQIADDRAEQITQLAEAQPGINDAAAIIIGNTALVGLDTDADAPELEARLAEKIQGKFPEIEEVLITRDPDLAARIRAAADKIQHGLTQNVLDEVYDIWNEMRLR